MITGFRCELTQDVDAMWESDASAEWERLNEEDPAEDKIRDAAHDIHDTWEKLSDALDCLATAADKVENTVAYDKVVSFMNELEDFQCGIHIMMGAMERGRC